VDFLIRQRVPNNTPQKGKRLKVVKSSAGRLEEYREKAQEYIPMREVNNWKKNTKTMTKTINRGVLEKGPQAIGILFEVKKRGYIQKGLQGD